MNLQFEYIAKMDEKSKYGFNSSQYGSNNYLFFSGETEVLGDLFQVCAQSTNASNAWPFINCMTDDMSAIPNNVQTCATNLYNLYIFLHHFLPFF